MATKNSTTYTKVVNDDGSIDPIVEARCICKSCNFKVTDTWVEAVSILTEHIHENHLKKAVGIIRKNAGSNIFSTPYTAEDYYHFDVRMICDWTDCLTIVHEFEDVE